MGYGSNAFQAAKISIDGVTIIYDSAGQAQSIGLFFQNVLGQTPTISTNGWLLFENAVHNVVLVPQTDGYFAIINAAQTGQATFQISTATGIPEYLCQIPTAGLGWPVTVAQSRSTAQTGAVASVATYTVGAADGSFIVNCNINVTASTSFTFNAQVVYFDETNTQRTTKLVVSNNGSFITAVTNTIGAIAYPGVPIQIRAKAATAITISTTGTFTTVTYNVEGIIQQLA